MSFCSVPVCVWAKDLQILVPMGFLNLCLPECWETMLIVPDCCWPFLCSSGIGRLSVFVVDPLIFWGQWKGSGYLCRDLSLSLSSCYWQILPPPQATIRGCEEGLWGHGSPPQPLPLCPL